MKFGAVFLLSTLILAAPAAATAQDEREAQANAAFVAYPKASLESGEQGVVHYRVKIDGRGRARECEVVRSSGYTRLDMATCDILMSKAQFTPSGERKRSEFEGRVHWRLS